MPALRIGEIYGLWRVLERTSLRSKNHKPLYKCECLKCGNISFNTADNISRSRGRSCKNCTPNYHFVIENATAAGILVDGSRFLISAEDVPKVSQYRWYMNTNTGYINTTQHENHQTPLHRFVMGLNHSDGLVVDHINRIKTDCRRENLRIVTVAQNTLNKGLRFSSRSGFRGVSAISDVSYKAVINIQHRDIRLGISSSPEECAQMYNCANDLLYGDFGGYRNNVPEASSEMKQRIKKICMPYMEIAKNVTSRSCHGQAG